jgi:hypothetical protein
MSRIQSDAGVGRRGPRGKSRRPLGISWLRHQRRRSGPPAGRWTRRTREEQRETNRARTASSWCVNTHVSDTMATPGRRTGPRLHRSLKPRGRSTVSFPPTVHGELGGSPSIEAAGNPGRAAGRHFDDDPVRGGMNATNSPRWVSQITPETAAQGSTAGLERRRMTCIHDDAPPAAARWV